MNKERKKILFWTFIIVPICSWCIWLFFLSPSNPYYSLFKQTVFEPIPQEILLQICPKMEEIENYEICTQYNIKTEEDLYLVFVEMVSDGYLQTHEEWKMYFGIYEKRCDPLQHNEEGRGYNRCIYDFYENEIYYSLMVFFFRKDGEIMEIRPSATGGS